MVRNARCVCALFVLLVVLYCLPCHGNAKRYAVRRFFSSGRLHAKPVVVANQEQDWENETQNEELSNDRNVEGENEGAGRTSFESDSSLSLPTETTKCIANPKPPRSQRVLPWMPRSAKNGLASGSATILTKLLLQPFDTIKTLQQLNGQPLCQTARLIVRERGLWHGLWAGTVVSSVCAAPSNALYFAVFQMLKARLVPRVSAKWRSLAVAVAAMIGNALAAVLRVPYEVS